MKNEFDYIVVGAGSAGSAVAARLAEDPEVTVLLLEAGGAARHLFMAMPLAFRKVAFNRSCGWGYASEPEPGLNQRCLEIPRGRALGGSSSVNALICIRGNRRDYDLLGEAGLTGWGYADVLPYFKRLESNWRGETPYHGGSGPIGVTPMHHEDLLFEPLAEAARTTGVPLNDDPNGATQEGLSRMEATIRGGRRDSAARGYLRTPRANLTILTGAHTRRVLLQGRRAVGVEVLRAGATEQFRAKREVVLSGGSFNTPQLLMLSGIGPADHLREVGVDVVHDLPAVGANLSEHPNFVMTFAARGEIGYTRHLRHDRAALGGARWLLSRQGVFATNGGAANVFMRTEAGADRPDVGLILMPLKNDAEMWFPGLTAPPVYGFAVRIGALHPQARGSVRLRSNDFRDAPRIRFNLLTEERDVQAMLRGVALTRELYGSGPMSRYVAGEVSPGPKAHDAASLVQQMRATGAHRAHPVGTCRMGIDADSVVDPSLRVRGMEGLRVADASILPEVPSGNTNIPSIMIGEKAADLIRGRCLPAFDPAAHMA
jgi:choline dehydrogenase